MSATAPGFHAPAVIDYEAQPWMRTPCPECGAPPDHCCRERLPNRVFVVRPLTHKARRVPKVWDLPEDWPVAYTDNGVKIVPGLRVLDYNRRESVVTDAEPHWGNGPNETRIPWFYTESGMFDGSRLLAL